MALEERAYRRPAETARDRTERHASKMQPMRRRYELDWLRVMIILGAMVFHAVYELELYYP
jgi:peptidoglycan/LPS O-acetylase OafA/YrhL